MKTLVSVVIPTYNREKTIKRAVDSVLAQTYQNFELLIVDDGSNDKTKQIIDEYNDERIKYIYQNNSGAQVARNNGLRNAKGEYISFLDSDDEWCSNFLEEFLKEFENPEIGCVYCLSGMLNENGEIYSVREDILSGNIYKEALKQGYITSPTYLMMRKSCFDTIGYWDENLKACQDDDICFRLAKHFQFKLIKKPLAIMHSDGDNRIMGDNLRYSKAWEVLWDKYAVEIVKECGKKVLAGHYYKTVKLYSNYHFYKEMYRAIFKCLKYNFSIRYIYYAFKHFIKGKICNEA